MGTGAGTTAKLSPVTTSGSVVPKMLSGGSACVVRTRSQYVPRSGVGIGTAGVAAAPVGTTVGGGVDRTAVGAAGPVPVQAAATVIAAMAARQNAGRIGRSS